MRPDDQHNRRVGTPLIPQRSLLHTSSPSNDHDTHAQAAAGIARGNLRSIYSGNTTTPTPQTTPVAVTPQTDIAQPALETASPYERTQTNLAEVQPDQWKQYHSAWQDYYQKYYERYYVGQVYRAQQALEARAAEAKQSLPTEGAAQPIKPDAEPETLTKKEAMYDLRSKLRNNVQESAKKVRKSRHFVPITAALCVMFVFLFLQYNRVLFANVQAYISPGTIDPTNIIIDPTTNVVVSSDPKLIIPKINVDVPVQYNATPDYNSQMKAMENGVAYFGIPGANSRPGQVGNTVFSGHSSNDIIDQGNYKFIFARLEQLANGDTIFVNYESKRYTYTVTKKEVVKPTEVSKLVYATDKPILTLITCTPIGTSTNRLLVTAEQVSPSPKEANAPPTASTTGNQSAAMPGNSPTFIQRLFGGSNQ